MTEQQKPEVPLDKFGRRLPNKSGMGGKYHVPCSATDAVVIFNQNGRDKILLIRRKKNPFEGCLALPGGFTDYNESTENSVMREQLEETNVEGKIDRLVTVKSDPLRDPRMHIISVSYLIIPTKFNPDGSLYFKAADDAISADLYDILDVFNNQDKEDPSQKLAFDHLDIIKEAYGYYLLRSTMLNK